MDMKNVLMLAFLGLLDLSPGMSITYQVDIAFHEELTVNNRTVTCNGTTAGRKYNFKMYTCADIRVDGWRVFHGNNDFKNVLDKTPNNNGCPGCPCGSYTAEPNDVLALCTALLAAHGESGEVIAAFTPVPVCTQKIPENRIKYFVEDGEAKWLEVSANNGYLSKLQCAVMTSD